MRRNQAETDPPPPPRAATIMSGAGWTAGEDRRLEAALAAHPATLEKGARWTLISEAVGGGRGRRECVARYKAIREAILAQQRRREEKEEKEEKKEEKEKEEEEKENCHLFITARRTDEGRDKNEDD